MSEENNINVSDDILHSIEKLCEYSWADEKKDYEESFGELPEGYLEDADKLTEKKHIFYHICVLNQFANQ